MAGGEISSEEEKQGQQAKFFDIFKYGGVTAQKQYLFTRQKWNRLTKN
ncbi:hypothetical protein HMPREF1870_00501 [Bacteroidales bacterium KA00344]|nr:hypothetical protein HMPREF1870_00501 [Bacteroidales bacterium KA00344]